MKILNEHPAVLYKTLVIVIILLFIVMSIIPSVAVDTVNIEHANGKSPGDDTDWWPMFRHDLQHSGNSTSNAPDTSNVLWSYKIGYCVYSSPAVADGKVYVSSYDGIVYAFGELDPDAPSTPEIDGQTKCVPDVLYNFTFKSTSPLGDDLYYWIEWADGSNSGWLGPTKSSVGITESHVWDAKGVYPIQAKAKDINGLVSGWGILGVTIPRNRATVDSLFQLFFDKFPMLERLLSIITNKIVL